VEKTSKHSSQQINRGSDTDQTAWNVGRVGVAGSQPKGQRVGERLRGRRRARDGGGRYLKVVNQLVDRRREKIIKWNKHTQTDRTDMCMLYVCAFKYICMRPGSQITNKTNNGNNNSYSRRLNVGNGFFPLSYFPVCILFNFFGAANAMRQLNVSFYNV